MLLLLAVACAVVPRGLTLTAISDLLGAAMMLCACIAFFILGLRSSGRVRWFWMLQASGWILWFCDQVVWIAFDLILQTRIPSMYPADALLFLAGAPMIAGFLLRPHRQSSTSRSRLGMLDFLLLLLWWLYLYVAFVVCWQYPSPNEPIYSRNYDALSAAESVLLTVIALMFWRENSGRWKRFYAFVSAAVVFNGVAFYVINKALERHIYYTGSWYDIPYCGSFTLFTVIPLWGENLLPLPENAADESYNSSIASLAMTAVLSLPIIAFLALIDPRLPKEASSFRVLVTLATMFLMAAILFIQHRRLNRELQRTNLVLEEASLTDPLTGLRNRRYFSATIEADVGQALRSHADSHDSHTRDLVFYLIDADNFKEVNDRYGHDVGDKVLVEMAQRLSSSIRHSDVLVRWGGEEFLIVSRYTDRANAEWLAQRVLSAVGDKPFSLGNSGESIHRTCSLGWAPFPWFPENPRALGHEEVLTLADRALHHAKESGRNCAVGMLAATGKVASTRVAGLHSSSLEVDVMAIAGPHAAV
jgi:diguanylate cyclase (GGDEF)-like protein